MPDIPHRIQRKRTRGWKTYCSTMEPKSIRFEIRLPAELAEDINAWRRQQTDPPNRAEAARRLIELGLEAAKSKEPPQ